jgi:hypothetical protein
VGTVVCGPDLGNCSIIMGSKVDQGKVDDGSKGLNVS